MAAATRKQAAKPFVQWMQECDARHPDKYHVAPEIIKKVYPALRRKLAKLKPLAAPRPRAHTDFVAAFRDGQAFLNEYGERLEVTCVEAGKLVLPTGKIVTCDPALTSIRTTPLARHVKPGQYPVVFSLLNDEPIAAMIRFSKRIPTRWELALWPGQSLDELEGDQVFSFGVDTATGCFVDASAFEQLQEAEVIVDKRWLVQQLDPRTQANVVAYDTHADGRYCSYWGLDANDKPLCLVTEIYSLVTEERACAGIGGIFHRPAGEIPHGLFESAGVFLEVIPGSKVGELIVALFGPRSGEASFQLTDATGNEIDSQRGDSCAGSYQELEYRYDSLAVSKEAVKTAGLRVWISLGLRAYQAI